MNDPYSPPSESLPPPPPAMHSQEERTWAMIAHLSALTALISGFGMIVGPLVVWLVNKDSRPYAAAAAKEALNFNISWFLWSLLVGVAAFILTFILIGIFLWIGLAIASVVWLVLCIIAGIKANEGTPYRYPLTVRFIA